MDIVDDRRGHTRRIQSTERPECLRTVVLGRSVPRHRRLDTGHERHPALHPEVRSEQPGALHRARADPHPGPHREAAAGDRPVRARALLGALHPLPRHPLHRHEGQVHQQGRGRAKFRSDTGQALHRDRRAEEERHRGPTLPLRPHLAAGGLQQEVRHERRHDLRHRPDPLRAQVHHLPPCGHPVPERRHLPQMPRHTARTEGLRGRHHAPALGPAQEEQESVRHLEGDRPPRHHPHRRGPHRTHRHGAPRVRPGDPPLHSRLLPRLPLHHHHGERQGRRDRIQGHRQADTESGMARALCQGSAAGRR